MRCAEPFVGKVVVVTGAASGIGLALARQLAERGAGLALLDCDAEGLARTAGALGARATRHTVDVTDVDTFARVADDVVGAHGQVDVVINNAGVLSRWAPFVDLSQEEFMRCFAVNFWGAVNGSRLFLPHLLARPEAALVNVSSVAGVFASPLQSPYVASKFAVRGLTEALRYELLFTRVHVTCVIPGVIRTELGRNTPAQSYEERARNEQRQESFARTSAETAAKRIIRGIERRKPRLTIGPDGFALDRLARWLPAASLHVTLPMIMRDPIMRQPMFEMDRRPVRH